MVIGDEAQAFTQCADCKKPLKTEVLKSNAGFYLGTWCDNCGPYARESSYFATRAQAESTLRVWQDSGEKPWARKEGFQG